MAAARLETPALIGGKYALLGELGSGGMGTVYDAENVLVGKRVALKLLHPHLAGSPRARARFLAEARSAARVCHENVVDVLDVGADASGCYIVMQRLEGETLEAIVSTRGPLPVRYACELMLQVLSALSLAHARGIVHRDLKPANVMVTHLSPTQPVVKVLDFGIAGTIGDAAAAADDETFIGTPQYMSPEQMLGDSVDATADLYACAAMLFELLFGRPPYDDETVLGVIGRVLRQDRPSLGELAPHLPPKLLDVLEWALATEPAQRPASATILATALAPWAGHDSCGFDDEADPLLLVAPRGREDSGVRLKGELGADDDDAFPDPELLGGALGTASVNLSLLTHPRFPRAPLAVRMDARALGLPDGSPLPGSSERAQRVLPTAQPQRPAPAKSPRGSPALAGALMAASGFVVGLVLAWLSGAV
jgi:serine/threonine protein kinase